MANCNDRRGDDAAFCSDLVGGAWRGLLVLGGLVALLLIAGMVR
ncbi:MAG: hypothetical protein AB7O45_11925 [Alphaproteobacteria bacterium]